MTFTASNGISPDATQTFTDRGRPGPGLHQRQQRHRHGRVVVHLHRRRPAGTRRRTGATPTCRRVSPSSTTRTARPPCPARRPRRAPTRCPCRHQRLRLGAADAHHHRPAGPGHHQRQLGDALPPAPWRRSRWPTTGSPDRDITESGALPSGVTFTDNGDGTATLAGTAGRREQPAATRSRSPRRTGVSPAASQSFTLTVNAAPDRPGHHQRQLGRLHGGHPGVVPGGRPPGSPAAKITESGALPSGVTFTDNGDGTATLAGTAGAGTAAATRSRSPRPTGSPGRQPELHAHGQPGGPPVITSADHATFAAGTAGTFPVTTTGFPSATCRHQQPGAAVRAELQGQRGRDGHPGRHAASGQPGHLRPHVSARTRPGRLPRTSS